ncbi:MAG: flagellar protein FliT [Xanthomonadaceae bacterium]|nr:flagellar protein FliT [Xanthomonadaceae bacterium]
MAGVGEEKRRKAFQLLELTRSLLKHARAGDWVALARGEQERQDLARSLFSTPVPPDAAPTVAECIRQVLALDTELLALISASREEAAKAMQEARQGRKAVEAYRRFSR